MGLQSTFSSWAKSLLTIKPSSYFFYKTGDREIYSKNTRVSDEEIIDYGYVANPLVYSVVTKVSSLMSRLPYRIENNEKEIENDYSKFLLTLNTDIGRKELLNRIGINLLNTGDVFLLKSVVSIGFDTKELYVLPSQMVTVEKIGHGYDSPVKCYVFNNGNGQKRYLPEEIIHIQLYDPSEEGVRSGKGLSPFQPGNLSIRSSNNASVAEATIFENGAPQHLIFKKKGGGSLSLTGQDKKNIDEATKERFGGAHNTGAIKTVTGEAEVLKVGSTPKELGTAESQIQSLRTIANLVGGSSAEWNDPDNKHYNNAKEARMGLYEDVAIPFFEFIMEKIILKTAAENGEVPFNISVRVETSKIKALNPSPLEVSKHNLQKYKDGAISLEHYRLIEDIEDTGTTFVKSTGLNNTQNGSQE